MYLISNILLIITKPGILYSYTLTYINDIWSSLFLFICLRFFLSTQIHSCYHSNVELLSASTRCLVFIHIRSLRITLRQPTTLCQRLLQAIYLPRTPRVLFPHILLPSAPCLFTPMYPSPFPSVLTPLALYSCQ